MMLTWEGIRLSKDDEKVLNNPPQMDSAGNSVFASRTSSRHLANGLRNGTMMKSLTQNQSFELVEALHGHVSSRKLYLKVACLAVLKYDSSGEPLSPAEVANRSRKYTQKNCTMSPRTCASVLAMLSRLGLIGRTPRKPFHYWWGVDGN